MKGTALCSYIQFRCSVLSVCADWCNVCQPSNIMCVITTIRFENTMRQTRSRSELHRYQKPSNYLMPTMESVQAVVEMGPLPQQVWDVELVCRDCRGHLGTGALFDDGNTYLDLYVRDEPGWMGNMHTGWLEVSSGTLRWKHRRCKRQDTTDQNLDELDARIREAARKRNPNRKIRL